MNYVALAIPFFLLLIIIELAVDYWRKSGYYQLNDTVNSLHIGILSQMSGLVRRLIQFSAYALVFQHIALFSLPTSEWWVWVLAFVGYDLCYYWYHRLSHEINGLWASHVVHHQSEEYNLSTALRQTSGSIVSFVFYLPLAVIGIDPIVLISVGSLNLIYQFWVHTRHINKMPAWFEFIFVTPSNHRVHHAQNPVYLDRNYGGVFIIWDRLFNTYHPELDDEPVIFGVTKPLASWNPVWANLEVYWSLMLDSFRTQSWSDKIRVWYKRTGWRPEDVKQSHPSPVFDPYKLVKYDVQNSWQQKAYVLFQHLSTLGFVLVILYQAFDKTASEIFITFAVVGYGLLSLGMIQQLQKYSYIAEALKIFVWSAFVIYGPYDYPVSISLVTVWALISAVLLGLSYKALLGKIDTNSASKTNAEAKEAETNNPKITIKQPLSGN